MDGESIASDIKKKSFPRGFTTWVARATSAMAERKLQPGPNCEALLENSTRGRLDATSDNAGALSEAQKATATDSAAPK